MVGKAVAARAGVAARVVAEVRDQAVVAGTLVVAAVARVQEVAAIPGAGVVAVRAPEVVVTLVAEGAAAADVPVARVALPAAVVVVEVPAVAAGPVVAVAAPRVPAVVVAVVKEAVGAVGGKVRAEARAVEVGDRVVVTAGGPVVEAIGSFPTAGGRESARQRFSWIAPWPYCPPVSPAPRQPSALQPKLRVHWLSSSQREALMGTPRGREARLRAEYAGLYPGLKPGVWAPVEKLLRQVTDIIHKDRSKSGVITGRRLLHDDHFEYRGTSPRPEGLPEGDSRLSDSSGEPNQRTGSHGPPGQRSGRGRESHR